MLTVLERVMRALAVLVGALLVVGLVLGWWLTTRPEFADICR